MKKGRIIAAVVALLVIAGVGACVVIGAQAAIPTVRTVTVEKGDLARTVTVSGDTAKDSATDVYPPTAGTLAEVFVEDGDVVEAGDPLAVLDTEPLELQVAGAEAAYLAAIAQVDTLEAQAPSQTDIDAAQMAADLAYDGWEQAVAQTGQLEGVIEGLRLVGVPEFADLGSMVTTDPATIAALAALDALVAQGILPTADGMTLPLLDLQVVGLESAEDQAWAAYLQAQSAADALENTDLSASLDSARAACEQARLSLELAQRTLDEATMTAPIDGVVVFNTAAAIGGVDVGAAQPGPGYSVSPAAAPFTIVRLGFLEFVADVDEADVDALEVGMSATVVLDAFPGEEFATEVRKVGVVSQLTATGGNAFPVYLDLSETGFGILIGMRGSADIELEVMPGTISIPIEALFDEGGQSFVYQVVDGALDRIDIETGIYTDTHVEVVSGLDGGEEIVETSSDFFADGMPVRVDNDAPSGPTSPFGG